MDLTPNPRLTIERLEDGIRVQLEHRFNENEWFVISAKLPAGDQSLVSVQADLFARFQRLWREAYGKDMPPLLKPIDPA